MRTDKPRASGKPGKMQNNSLIYIARQPIFNLAQNLYAYELLYRDTEQNSFNTQMDGDLATGTVISESILNFGMSELTNGKKAFINFTQGYILNKAAWLLNPDQFVIEILENVVFTTEVIDAIYTLKATGFSLALDDYVGVDLSDELLSLIDIIKIDFLATTKEKRAEVVPHLRNAGKILLAEKVETKEDLEEAFSLGCQLFQGYYYSKPSMLKKTRLDISSVSYLKLSEELALPDINLERIAWIIHWDAHLTYKLLKRMKTLQYYRGNAITSIQRALVMMGNEEVRRWIMLVLIRGIIDSKSDELVRIALIRAFFCEKLAGESNHHSLCSEAFSTGMFSIIPYEDNFSNDSLKDFQIPEDIKDALSGKDNLLHHFLNLAMAYENGNWEKLEQLLDNSAPLVNIKILPGLYLLSISAADEMLSKDE